MRTKRKRTALLEYTLVCSIRSCTDRAGGIVEYQHQHLLVLFLRSKLADSIDQFNGLFPPTLKSSIQRTIIFLEIHHGRLDGLHEKLIYR